MASLFLSQVTSPLAESGRCRLRDVGSKLWLYAAHILLCAFPRPADTVYSTCETENHQFREQTTLKL